VVAESVEEAIRIGRDARRSQGDQRSDGGGRAFQRKPIEQAAIHVRVRGRLGFDEISTVCLNVHGLSGGPDL